MFNIFKKSKKKFDSDKIIAYTKAEDPGYSANMKIYAIDKNNNSKFICLSKNSDADRLIKELTDSLKNKNLDKTNKSVNFKFLNNN